MARQQGAEVIDFEREDPVKALLWLTDGIGVDRAIDAVGVDAEHSHGAETVAPSQGHKTDWQPGNAPSQVLDWAVASLAKAGSLGIIGVYGPDQRSFPIGEAMNKNLTVKMGNCHHRRYIPKLIEMVLARRIDPATILTQVKPMSDAIGAFEAFDQRETGWVKVELQPQRQQSRPGDEETVRPPRAPEQQ